MTAAKRIILCLWLVLLGVAHAPAAVLDASENRVWKKIDAPQQTRLVESSQVAGSHQENAPPGWGTVSGCCLAAKGITNPLPANGIFSRVMPREYAEAFARGEGTIAGSGEVFIGAADDLAGITTRSGAQSRLALYNDAAATIPNLGGDTLVTFRLQSVEGIGFRSPIQTVPPRGYGFTPGGRTGGDAREWLINNGTAGDLGVYDIQLSPLR